MIEPTHDRIQVRPTVAAAMSGGAVALHIPEAAREQPQTGELLGVGPAVTSCRVGDEVLYGKYTGDEVPVDGEDFLFIRDGDVIGVEKGPAWRSAEGG